MHLSRLGSEIVIWSSSEFGFCELDESFSSGSLIMPQKKNPDSAELLRAKAPRVVASTARRCSGCMHALPLTYGKDMQEDKEPLFDAIDTIELCLEAAERDARRDRASTASGWRRPPATRCWRRPRSPTCWSARACRSARPTGSSAAWSATRSSTGRSLSELTAGGAARALRAARRRVLRGAASGAAGSSRSGSRAAPLGALRARRRSSEPRRGGALRRRSRADGASSAARRRASSTARSTRSPAS